MDHPLLGKIAIVTGAAQGIGRAVGDALADHGAGVALVDVQQAGIERAAAEIRARGRQAIAVQADVAHADQVTRLVAQVLSAFGTIDILVNNAGVLRNTPIAEMPEAEWDLVVDVCLKGAFLCSRAVLSIMMAKRSGRIVNISSLAARSTSVFGGAAYTAAKAGLLGFSRHCAREAAPYGITVNAICPGGIDTPMTRKGAGSVAHFEEMAKAVPIGRWAAPAEIAHTVLFLVSDAASFITGATLDVNGGLIMV